MTTLQYKYLTKNIFRTLSFAVQYFSDTLESFSYIKTSKNPFPIKKDRKWIFCLFIETVKGEPQCCELKSFIVSMSVKLCFILPLSTSLSSIIDACQGKIKRFSLGKHLCRRQKDVDNGENRVLILIT